MRRIWILLALAVLAGCVDKARAPILGMWNGGFYTDEAEVLRGYLQLYRTGDKFKMRLATREQEMDMAGTWTVTKGRVELRVADVKFNNPAEDIRKAMGIQIFDPERVRAAYSKPITLDVSENGATLQGLTITLDRVQGSHKFSKGAVTSETRKALDRMENKR